jgi:zinc transporter
MRHDWPMHATEPSPQPTDDCDDPYPLLFGRVLDGQGGGRPIDWDAAQDWRPQAQGELLWVHLCRDRPGVEEWLRYGLQIPETTANLLTSSDTRPRAFREGQTLVATLRGINFNPGAEPEDMVSMQLWCDGARLITLRRLPLQTPRRTLAEVDAGTGPSDAGALVTALAKQLIDHVHDAVVDMNQEIDRLEDQPFESANREAMLAKTATIRRNCLALQRHMGPQHAALEAISHDSPDWFDEHDRRRIAESIERLQRYLHDIDISKESAVVLMDELRSLALARSERTNQRLTLVATVFLPLGFVTGLFGINVGGMPMAELPGNPYGFWTVAALCTGLGLFALWLFRRWRRS